MPLHISLGLGTQVLDIIESEALKLDAAVKKAECKTTDELTAAYSKRKELHKDISCLRSILEEQREEQLQLQHQLTERPCTPALLKKTESREQSTDKKNQGNRKENSAERQGIRRSDKEHRGAARSLPAQTSGKD